MSEVVKGVESESESASLEEQASISRLEAAAGVDEAAAAGVGQAEAQAAPAMSAEQSLAGLLSAGGNVAAFVGYRRIGAVWNEQASAALAERVVPVLRKYPWGGRVIEFLEGGSGVEELALVMVAVPMVTATLAAYRADAADMADMAKAEGAAGGGEGPVVVDGTGAK